MSDTEKEVTKSAPKMAQTDMDAELKRLELESKQLEVAEKKANLQDVQERLAERELKREAKRQISITNGTTLKQLAQNDLAAQKRCNHRKGGNGAAGVVGGQGDDSQYAVLKHIMHNGDTWIRCLRCGKTWKPPVKTQFKNEEDYIIAYTEYQAALQFQTRNVTSGSVRFGYSDGGKLSREIMANSNLR